MAWAPVKTDLDLWGETLIHRCLWKEMGSLNFPWSSRTNIDDNRWLKDWNVGLVTHGSRPKPSSLVYDFWDFNYGYGRDLWQLCADYSISAYMNVQLFWKLDYCFFTSLKLPITGNLSAGNRFFKARIQHRFRFPVNLAIWEGRGQNQKSNWYIELEFRSTIISLAESDFNVVSLDDTLLI